MLSFFRVCLIFGCRKEEVLAAEGSSKRRWGLSATELFRSPCPLSRCPTVPRSTWNYMGFPASGKGEKGSEGHFFGEVTCKLPTWLLLTFYWWKLSHSQTTGKPGKILSVMGKAHILLQGRRGKMGSWGLKNYMSRYNTHFILKCLA